MSEEEQIMKSHDLTTRKTDLPEDRGLPPF